MSTATSTTATSSSSPSREQFCSFISEFIDKSKKIIVESEDVLDYDAVELTLLLKSIGFQLQSLEFASKPDEESRDIEIEIKCKRSGIHSKLTMLTNNCTCPMNDPSSNNNSFWEVQGIAPVSCVTKPQGLVQDRSCNLIPEITKKTNNLARTMLTILQQHYKADFDPKEAKLKQIDVKEVLERFQAKNNTTDTLQPNSDSINYISPNNVAEKTNQHCSTPLSSINVTPIPSYESNNGAIVNLLPKIITYNQTNNNSDNNNETSETNLTTDTDKQYITTSESVNSYSVNLDVTNIVLKENETALDQLNPENEKEIYLIESISEARKNLDTALLLLKCNVTREISPGSSILTVTPQNLRKKWQNLDSRKENSPSGLMSLPVERSKISNSNNLAVGNNQNIRRHSYGGRNDIILSSTRSGNNNLSNDYLKRNSKISTSTGKLIKPDTPRPTERKAYGIEASLVKKALSVSHIKSTNSTKPPNGKTIPKLTTTIGGNANGIKKSIK